ncbi:MAG: aminotransferase class V-fold PLP-dependent enzyme [Armatimonadota bacterium]
MKLIDELGVRRVVNASATLTRLGGSLMPPEVIDAMRDVADAWIDLEELQARVGEEIARITNNEAAMVVTGAAAGICLAVAAAMVGDDVAARDRLPVVEDLRNEVAMYQVHRNGYDVAARMTGARLILVGNNEGASPEDLASALGPRTACVLWFQGAMTGRGEPTLDETIAVAKRRGVPVFVDAAAQLPPASNLWSYTRAGADLAIFSGGKDLRGPQASGLVVGARYWIDRMRPLASPNSAIGRPMKVGKEETAGLLAAVRRYLALDHEALREREEAIVAQWCRQLASLPEIRIRRDWPNEAGQPSPRARIDCIAKVASQALVAELWNADPRVAVGHDGDSIYLNPMTVADDEVELVARAIAEAWARLANP